MRTTSRTSRLGAVAAAAITAVALTALPATAASAATTFTTQNGTASITLPDGWTADDVSSMELQLDGRRWSNLVHFATPGEPGSIIYYDAVSQGGFEVPPSFVVTDRVEIDGDYDVVSGYYDDGSHAGGVEITHAVLASGDSVPNGGVPSPVDGRVIEVMADLRDVPGCATFTTAAAAEACLAQPRVVEIRDVLATLVQHPVAASAVPAGTVPEHELPVGGPDVDPFESYDIAVLCSAPLTYWRPTNSPYEPGEVAPHDCGGATLGQLAVNFPPATTHVYTEALEPAGISAQRTLTGTGFDAAQEASLETIASLDTVVRAEIECGYSTLGFSIAGEAVPCVSEGVGTSHEVTIRQVLEEFEHPGGWYGVVRLIVAESAPAALPTGGVDATAGTDVDVAVLCSEESTYWLSGADGFDSADAAAGETCGAGTLGSIHLGVAGGRSGIYVDDVDAAVTAERAIAGDGFSQEQLRRLDDHAALNARIDVTVACGEQSGQLRLHNQTRTCAPGAEVTWERVPLRWALTRLSVPEGFTGEAVLLPRS